MSLLGCADVAEEDLLSGQKGSSTGFNRAMALVGAGAGMRGASIVGTKAVALVTTALLVRLLGADLYGALALGLSVVALSAAVMRGFGIAATRTLAADRATGDREAARDVVRGLNAIVVAIVPSGLVVVMIIVVLSQGQLEMGQRVVVGLGLGVLLIGRVASGASEAVARGSGRVVLMAIPGLGEVLSRFAVALTLTALSIRTLGAVGVGFIIAGITATLVAAGVIDRAMTGFDHVFRITTSAAAKLARLTGPYAVASVAASLIASFDVFVLGLTHPGRPVGLYAPVLAMTEALTLLAPSLLMAMFVTAATRLIALGDTDGFERLYLTISRLMILSAMPALILLATSSTSLLRTAYGDDFPVGESLVHVLLIGAFLNVIFGANAQALIASGARRLLTRAFLWPGIVMLISSAALVPTFGPLGAAWATTLAYAALNVFMSWSLYRATGVHPLHRGLVILVATAPLAVVGAGAIVGLFGAGLWTNALISILVWVAWIFVARATGAFRFAELRGLLPSRTDKMGDTN